MKKIVFPAMAALMLLSACDMFTLNYGNKKDTPPFRVDEKGDTVVLSYYDNGTIKSEVTTKNSWKNGPAISYYPNGEKQIEMNYAEGEKQGSALTYYENGTLYRVSNYVEGRLEGVQKRFYEDGKLMAEIPYKNGEVQPGTKEYNEDGSIRDSYPEILLKLENKSAFENKFELLASLSKGRRDTKFYRLTDVDGQSHQVEPKSMRNGVGTFVWTIGKGKNYMEKITIVAEFTSLLNNPVRIEKPYNLALDNW